VRPTLAAASVFAGLAVVEPGLLWADAAGHIDLALAQFDTATALI
jgi:hypothetical protein